MPTCPENFMPFDQIVLPQLLTNKEMKTPKSTPAKSTLSMWQWWWCHDNYCYYWIIIAVDNDIIFNDLSFY